MAGVEEGWGGVEWEDELGLAGRSIRGQRERVRGGRMFECRRYTLV
jgi:hypothetical protein